MRPRGALNNCKTHHHLLANSSANLAMSGRWAAMALPARGRVYECRSWSVPRNALHGPMEAQDQDQAQTLDRGEVWVEIITHRLRRPGCWRWRITAATVAKNQSILFVTWTQSFLHFDAHSTCLLVHFGCDAFRLLGVKSGVGAWTQAILTASLANGLDSAPPRTGVDTRRGESHLTIGQALATAPPHLLYLLANSYTSIPSDPSTPVPLP